MHLSEIYVTRLCAVRGRKVQQLLKKAGEAVSGNYRGIEGVLHYDVELLKEAGALILYASLISGVSAWLVVLLVIISLVQILSYKLANNYELKHRDAKAKLTVTQDYLDRQAYAVENGKDIRLYQMKEWLSGHYRAANKNTRHCWQKKRHVILRMISLGCCCSLAGMWSVTAI